MLILYNIGIQLYGFAIFVASLFNNKAKLWIKGRKAQVVKPVNSSIWFHFASLGEFEQGRPVLEKMREQYPGKPIVVTFFSPSGYEIRKNTPLADAVYYLPLDTAGNARKFIEIINPSIAVFTKYEYWYHFFNELRHRDVPLYIISGIFRPDQVFFKWYGGLHRKMLGFVKHFFVQDEDSKQLLQTIGVSNVTVSGDTRFDRVWANAQCPKDLPLIKEFKGDHDLFIAGSTWPEDEKLIAGIINENPNWKFIIAPHEIDEEKIRALEDIFLKEKTIKHSQLTTHNPQPNILIIDNIGMLSSLYQYADIAYIGGGFGAGIHNTLEAVAFGLPVIFGPNYQKFREAREMIGLGAAFTVSDHTDLHSITNKFMDDDALRTESGNKAKKYVEKSIGATTIITDHIAV